jgi:hypothetical protein
LYTRNAPPGRPTLNFGGLGGPPPLDVIVLLAVVFVTFSLQFFLPGVVNLLRLTPAVWRSGFVWQLVTYPFMGFGGPDFWFLLELLILFLFARDVFTQLGRRHFWRLIVWAAVAAAAVALLVQAAVGSRTAEALGLLPFPLMQGQLTLMAITVAAFATMNRRATIYLFFVLPIEARWFLGLEILFAFMGFLRTRDLAGFLGICTAVGMTYLYLTKSGMRRGLLRDSRLRLQRWWIQRKMDRMRKKSGLRVIPGEGRGGKKNPWSSDRIH